MKSKIIEQLKLRGYTAQEGEKVLAAVTSSILAVAKVESGARVPGFGVFKVIDKAEKKGRNPQTGEAIILPARKAFTFKAAKDLTL